MGAKIPPIGLLETPTSGTSVSITCLAFDLRSGGNVCADDGKLRFAGHGTQEPWTNWDTLSSRFVAEFGMEGAPNIRTVDYWLDGNKSQRYPQSKWVCAHNKADGFERRLALYLVENFKHSYEMERLV